MKGLKGISLTKFLVGRKKHVEIMRARQAITRIRQGRAAECREKEATMPVGSTLPLTPHCWKAVTSVKQCRRLKRAVLLQVCDLHEAGILKY